MAFIDKLRPAPHEGGFRMPDYWVWGGSAIRGQDGRYHLFAARWPKTLPFFDGYKTHSEVVRAVSDTPQGPYAFQEVVLGTRDAAYWDGRMTHNPSIHRHGDIYLLFYIGATYEGPTPDGKALRAGATTQPAESYANIRIGLATAPSVHGPWTRQDTPILEPRPEKWDDSIVTNPAPCILDSGEVIMLYRANTSQGLCLGVTHAKSWHDSFRRLVDTPVLVFENGYVEDPYIWWNGRHFELLAKDMTGGLTGEKHAGIHATSEDAINWRLSDPAKAYSRRVTWDDGAVTTQGSLERPKLLLDNGQPTHLFAATADGPGGFRKANSTWTMVIPLAP